MKTILVDAVDCFVIGGEGIYQPLYDLLETYPHKKIILTNANDEQIKTFGLVDLPYELFTLKHNPDKVNPEYYRIMLDHLGLKSDEVVYFEHNPKAVDSAKLVGINTHFYDSEIKDIKSLKQFLDDNLDKVSGNELKILVNKPVYEVFQFAIDPKNTPKWVSSVEVEETDSWPISIGTEYRNKGSDDVWNEYKVIELMDNRVFTLQKSDGNYFVRYTFKSVDNLSTELKYFEWVKDGILSEPFIQADLDRFKVEIEKI